ncbi:MAG: EAL domain-containing protein [Azospirillaceae bacterium]|nr:EAL domain-containing protein [Azospirillaceae bacterium]
MTGVLQRRNDRNWGGGRDVLFLAGSAKSLPLALLVLALVITAIGYAIFRPLAAGLKQQQDAALTAVVELKARQVEGWLNEQRFFVRSRVEGTFLAGAIAAWLADRSDFREQRLLQQFSQVAGKANYVAVEFYDMSGQRLLAAGAGAVTPQEVRAAIAEAGRQSQPVLLDIHRDGGGALRLGFLGLVRDSDDPGRPALGALVYSVDPLTTIAARVREAPRDTGSAEMTLVRPDGDQVEFLTPLQDRPDAAAKLRVPLIPADPVGAALLRGHGAFGGSGYRGVDIISVGEPVPGTSWWVVGMVDRREAYRAVAQLGRTTAILVFAAMSISGLMVAMIARQRSLSDALARGEQLRMIGRLEHRFRVTLTSIGDAIIATDADGRIELLNHEAEALTGWTAAEAWGRPLDEVFRIINEETHQATENPVQRVLRQRQVVGLANHTILISRSGREMPIADSGAPIRDDTGAIIGVVLVFRDQSGERAVLRELHDNVTRLRALFDNLPQFIWVKDRDSVYVSCNASCGAAMGTVASAVAGRSDRDFFPPAQAEKYRADDRRIMAQGQLESIEETVVAKGRERIVHVTKIPLRDHHGLICGIIGIAEDITDRKIAEAKLVESEATYRSLFSNMLNGFAYCQMLFEDGHPVDFIYLAVNATFERLTGLVDVVGKRVTTVLPGIRESDPDLFKNLGRVAGGGGAETFEIFVQALQMWFSMTVYCPKPEHFVAVFDVTTGRKNAEERLRLAAQVFDRATEGIVVTDAQQRILTVNAAFTTITGYEVDEVLGQRPTVLASGRHGPAFFQDMWAGILQRGWWQGEIWNRQKSGEFYLAWLTINSVCDEAGNPINYVGMFNDITTVRENEWRIDYLATHDALTGLPNRVLFLDRLRQAITRVNRKAGRFALLFVDLDNFKVVNDSLGHAAGDTLLVEVARRLRSSTRSVDSVARFGGDEFALLIEDTDIGEAEVAARRIAATFEDSMKIGTQDIHVSVSIGICLFPDDGTDAETLFRNADTAMYHAKGAGKNTHQFFTQKLKIAADERLRIEAGLRRAIEHGDLRLHYQPQFELATGGIVGVEALVRWCDPEFGMISPNRFIPVAEQTGLIVGLGEWVADAACAQMADWRDRGIDMPRIAINLSAVQFRRGQPLVMLRRLLDFHHLAADKLVVELTESTLMIDADHAQRVLYDLKRLGLAISIDDFGTGFSSLAYLRRFPIDEVKIDRSFVNDVAHNADDRAIAQTIIAMAAALGLSVVAEGIETQEQSDTLRALDCRIGQGFLFSQPLSAVELIDRFDFAPQPLLLH